MLDELRVVLVRPRYPENIGAAARACLNMGCPGLVLVAPEDFEPDRALPLATPHARHLLESAVLAPDLDTALAGFSAAYGTTARLGGWRTRVLTPRLLAREVLDRLHGGGKVALVFGPEDAGLTNEEVLRLTGLCHIPTDARGSSLNLAQAVMVLLYECLLADLESRGPGGPESPAPAARLSLAEMETLFSALRETLLAIDYLKDQNTDYWMLPVRRFLARAEIDRAGFDMLMGLCRQVRWMSGRKS